MAALSGATGYYQSPQQLAIVKRILSARKIELLDVNLDQASVPDSCKVIPNELGTAPCMVFNFSEDKFGHKAVLYSLPGVPYEAERLLDAVVESIKQNFTLERICHRTILTFGIAESVLAKQIEAWEDALPKWLHLAYLPNATLGVRLRLSCFDSELPGRIESIDEQISKLKDILGDSIYGSDADSLQSILPHLLQGPPQASYQETLAVAESCTGGRLSELITSVAGCSAYYKGSITAYANEVKINVLGVDADIIKKHGAVSQQCAEDMAKATTLTMDSDYAIATTGIAGPGGGSKEKPVGTCWIAAAHRDRVTGEIEVISKQIFSMSSRSVNVQRFAANALNLLRLLIKRKLF